MWSLLSTCCCSNPCGRQAKPWTCRAVFHLSQNTVKCLCPWTSFQKNFPVESLASLQARKSRLDFERPLANIWDQTYVQTSNAFFLRDLRNVLFSWDVIVAFDPEHLHLVRTYIFRMVIKKKKGWYWNWRTTLNLPAGLYCGSPSACWWSCNLLYFTVR